METIELKISRSGAIFVAFLIGNIVLFLVLNSLVVSTQAAPETIKPPLTFKFIPRPVLILPPGEWPVEDELKTAEKAWAYTPNLGEEDQIRATLFAYFVGKAEDRNENPFQRKIIFLEVSGTDPSNEIMSIFADDRRVQKRSSSTADSNGFLQNMKGEKGEVVSIGQIIWNSKTEVRVWVEQYEFSGESDLLICRLALKQERWHLESFSSGRNEARVLY